LSSPGSTGGVMLTCGGVVPARGWHHAHTGEDKPSPLPFTGCVLPIIADGGWKFSLSLRYEKDYRTLRKKSLSARLVAYWATWPVYQML